VPREPRPPAEVDAFVVEVARRFGVVVPGDYRRFLGLTDGGQYDHALFYGVGLEDSVLERCDDLGSGRVLVIGGSGNVDACVLRADGRAEIVNLFDLDEVSESFGSFAGLLERVLGPGGGPLC
jgi:hypothetical protein